MVSIDSMTMKRQRDHRRVVFLTGRYLKVGGRLSHKFFASIYIPTRSVAAAYSLHRSSLCAHVKRPVLCLALSCHATFHSALVAVLPLHQSVAMVGRGRDDRRGIRAGRRQQASIRRSKSHRVMGCSSCCCWPRQQESGHGGDHQQQRATNRL